MQTINSNLSSILINQEILQGMQFNNSNNVMFAHNGFVNGNDPAFNFTPELSEKFQNFDSVMYGMFSAKEMISTANDGIFKMLEHGNSIRDLISKAREEDCSEESLQAIQDEVDARIAEINKIRSNTNFNGINPFDTAFTLDIPQWQDYLGLNKTDDAEQKEAEITDLIAEINVDMSMGINADGSDFNMGTSATIRIGYTEDGSLQITVDATMDFDLSGIQKEGVQSDNAMDIINNFLNLLTGKSNGLNSAANMFDSFMAKGTASIIGDYFSINATNDINIESETSDSLKGKIVQHAAITLDSTANQCPSIAINLL